MAKLPPPTRAEFIECARKQDLATSEGRKAVWVLLGRLGPNRKRQYNRLRDEYLKREIPIGDANRFAALDIAKELRDVVEAPKCGSVVQERLEPQESLFDSLLSRVREDKGKLARGIGQSVIWTAANLNTKVKDIDPETVPGPEALNMWKWAKPNETQFRSLYDSKRIPSRGIAEDAAKGFIDTGDPIDDIIGRLEKAKELFRSVADVAEVRDLQTAVEARDLHRGGEPGPVHRPAEERKGGVPELREQAAGERGAVDPGRTGGSAGLSDVGADAAHPAAGGQGDADLDGADACEVGSPDDSATTSGPGPKAGQGPPS